MIYTAEFLKKKINLFYEKKKHCYKVLEKIVKKMMDDCRYINGESLEWHNWGDEPKKLKYIPKDKEDIDFEKKLLEALSKNEIEKGGIKEDERKGIDINNKSGKRGYNVLVKL